MVWSATVIWLIIMAVLVIVELVTMGLTTIWFAAGALVATLLSAAHLPLWLQITAFVVVSIVLMYFTRPIAMKYFNKSRTKTNVDAMIGKKAVVISEIDNVEGIGRVKVDGMEWSARSAIGSAIAVGSVVTIESVDGVKLIVK